MFGIQNVPQRDSTECKLEDDNFVVYSSVCSFFIPCPIMLLLYCGMFRGLRRWEEVRKAKLRSSILVCRKFQDATASLPPLDSLPPPLPPIIKREELTDMKPELKDINLEELDPYPLESPDGPYNNSTPDHPYNNSLTTPEYKDSPVPTVVAYSNIRYNLHPQTDPHQKKRAKINCRERKAMKVLPVVVGEWDSFCSLICLVALCGASIMVTVLARALMQLFM